MDLKENYELASEDLFAGLLREAGLEEEFQELYNHMTRFMFQVLYKMNDFDVLRKLSEDKNRMEQIVLSMAKYLEALNPKLSEGEKMAKLIKIIDKHGRAFFDEIKNLHKTSE